MSCPGMFMPFISWEESCAKQSAPLKQIRHNTANKVFITVSTLNMVMLLTLLHLGSFVQPGIRTKGYASNSRQPHLLRCRPHPHLRENLARRIRARANAVRDADTTIPIARQREPGKSLAVRCDPLQSFEVSHRVLRHCRFPFVDARKQWLGIKRDHLPQFLANNSQDVLFTALQNLLVSRPSEKTTNERSILRNTMGKFVMNKGTRKHSFAFTARNQKSETLRQRSPHFFIVAESHGHRRAVLYLTKFTRQFLIRSLQYGRGGLRGGRDDHGVEMVRLIPGANSPTIILTDERLHRRRFLQRFRIQRGYQPIDHLLHAIFQRCKKGSRLATSRLK